MTMTVHSARDWVEALAVGHEPDWPRKQQQLSALQRLGLACFDREIQRWTLTEQGWAMRRTWRTAA